MHIISHCYRKCEICDLGVKRMKEKYKYYEDLPKEERKKFQKKVFKENKSIRYWHGFITGASIFIGVSIAQLHHQTNVPESIYFELFYVAGISGSLAVLFYRAIIYPQIKEAVERKINS